MVSQVDSEGHHYRLLTEVIDHKKYNSLITNVVFIRSINVNLQQKRTTHGRKILLKWKYGPVDFFPLKDFKHSKPVELAEYCVENYISGDPGFSFWVKETLHFLYWIILKVKSQYWIKSHNFGMHVPKIVKQLYNIGMKPGTEFRTKLFTK